MSDQTADMLRAVTRPDEWRQRAEKAERELAQLRLMAADDSPSLSELYHEAISHLPEMEQARRQRAFREALRRWTVVVYHVYRYGGKVE